MAHAKSDGKAGLGDFLGRRDTLRLVKIDQLTNQLQAGRSMFVKKKNMARQSLYNQTDMNWVTIASLATILVDRTLNDLGDLTSKPPRNQR